MEDRIPSDHELYIAAVDLHASWSLLSTPIGSKVRSRSTPQSYVLADDNGSPIKRFPIEQVMQHALKRRAMRPKIGDDVVADQSVPEAINAIHNVPGQEDGIADSQEQPASGNVRKEGLLFSMQGRKSMLEVFEDFVELTPNGIFGLVSHGLSGVKRIPYSSISAVQFKECGLTVGFIQFTIQGGREQLGGAFAAGQDENSFTFGAGSDLAENNRLAAKIKDYVLQRIALRGTDSRQSPKRSLSDELLKLKSLLDDDVITQEEFLIAKRRLIEG